MKSADNRKLRDIVNTKKQQEIMQNELDDLMNWNNINGMKFNNTKCKITHVKANKKHFLLLAKRMKSYQVQVVSKNRFIWFTSFLASQQKGQSSSKEDIQVRGNMESVSEDKLLTIFAKKNLADIKGQA